MQSFGVILNQILILSAVIVIGFIAVKTGYITEDNKNALSRIIVRITLPATIINSLTKKSPDGESFRNCVIVIIISFIVVAVLLLCGRLLARLLRLDRDRASVLECLTGFGNVVFLGYPIIEALFGAEGLLYAALYELANDAFVWTLGVYKLSRIGGGEQSSVKKNLLNLVNPVTISFLVSIFMMIFGLQFPGTVGTVISGLGGCTTYLSMLFIGGTLALVDFRHIYKQISLFVMTVFKMIIFPVILILLLKPFGLDEAVTGAVVLQAAMPSLTILIILAAEYKVNSVYAAEGIFVTTVASLFTIPLVYHIMTVIL